MENSIKCGKKRHICNRPPNLERNHPPQRQALLLAQGNWEKVEQGREQGWGRVVGKDGGRRGRSRKLSAVPGTEVNAGPGGRRKPPYLLSKPWLYLLCNQKHFVVPSVQPNDGRMLNSSSLSLPLFKTRIKRM